MSDSILKVTKKEHDAMKAKGIDDESLLKPGKYELRRRKRTATANEVAESNIQVEITLNVGLDLLKSLQAEAGSGDPVKVKKLIEQKLRQSMTIDSDKTAVEKRILADKKFIAALAREVKKAA